MPSIDEIVEIFSKQLKRELDKFAAKHPPREENTTFYFNFTVRGYTQYNMPMLLLEPEAAIGLVKEEYDSLEIVVQHEPYLFKIKIGDWEWPELSRELCIDLNNRIGTQLSPCKFYCYVPGEGAKCLSATCVRKKSADKKQ